VPFILAGFRLGLAHALTGVVVAELIAAPGRRRIDDGHSRCDLPDVQGLSSAWSFIAGTGVPDHVSVLTHRKTVSELEDQPNLRNKVCPLHSFRVRGSAARPLGASRCYRCTSLRAPSRPHPRLRTRFARWPWACAQPDGLRHRTIVHSTCRTIVRSTSIGPRTYRQPRLDVTQVRCLARSASSSGGWGREGVRSEARAQQRLAPGGPQAP